MEQLTNLVARLRAFIKRIIKRVGIFSLCSVAIVMLLMITPFWSKIVLFGLNKLPINVVTENSLLKTKAKFIVVLGGGLNRNANNDIQPNTYSRKRLEAGLTIHQDTHLPFLLSGVGSPWMKDWLEENDIAESRIKIEDKSLNTCENANFTAIKLRNHGVNHVYLVTDAYHMSRARRLFARQGVFTTPIVANISHHAELTWETPLNNFKHSRRAVYEAAANVRDTFMQQLDCRTTPPFKEEDDISSLPKMADELL